MRTHTLLTKIASIAVCFGVMMSGPVMAGANSMIRDVELSQTGTLFGQVYTAQGKAMPNAVVYLQYQGKAVAAARTNTQGQFSITGVRAGAHELVAGTQRTPVRLWTSGTAPRSSSRGVTLAADDLVVRGQDMYSNGPSGFGMLDVITLATVGTSTAALVVGLDNRNTLDDIQESLPASP